MLSTQEALNEIARQLLIQNQIDYIKLNRHEAMLLGGININKNLDKIEAELPPYEKPKNIFGEQQDATKN